MLLGSAGCDRNRGKYFDNLVDSWVDVQPVNKSRSVEQCVLLYLDILQPSNVNDVDATEVTVAANAIRGGTFEAGAQQRRRI